MTRPIIWSRMGVLAASFVALVLGLASCANTASTAAKSSAHASSTTPKGTVLHTSSTSISASTSGTSVNRSHPAPETTSSVPGTSAPARSEPAPQETVIEPLVLFEGNGAIAPGVDVTHTTEAEQCITPGVAGGGSYRCFTSRTSPGGPSFVFDPCFAAPGSTTPTTLLCPTDPATGAAIELHGGSLPPPSTAPTRVWAIELSNQQVCVFVNAALGGFGPFSCTATGTNGPYADCHVPEQGSPWWTASCQPAETSSSPFSPVEVRVGWN